MNLPLSTAELRSILPSRSRGQGRRNSFLIGVALPTLLVFLYLSLIAAPQYVVRVNYDIFLEGDGAKNLTSLGVTVGRQARTFDYIVNAYVTSPQIVADLGERMKLATMFKPGGWDVVFTFWWDNGTPERLSRYWRNWVIDANHDSYSNLNSIEIRAFSPQDALKLAQSVMELGEHEINKLGQRARDTALAAVTEEVERADARLQEAIRKLAEFRQTQRIYLPSKPADSTEALAASLRQTLASMNAQYAALIRTLSPTSPAIQNLKSQIAGTEQELDRVSGMLGDGAAGADTRQAGGAAQARLPGQLSAFELIEAERSFAASARELALRHLEQVRFDAKAQRLYLDAFVQPSLPRQASYPRVASWTALTFVGLSVCWMIATLLFFSMRDHTR